MDAITPAASSIIDCLLAKRAHGSITAASPRLASGS